MLQSLIQDLRSAWRSLRMDPVFTTGVVATLALAIGVNAAMFGLADRLTFRAPPHVTAADDIYRVYFNADFGSSGMGVISGYSYPEYLDMKSTIRAFESVSAYTTDQVTVGTGESAKRARAVIATASFLDMLGVKPHAGRFFDAVEDRPGAPEDVVVLSWRYWQQEYGGTRDAIGRTIEISRRPYRIIGVTPRGFRGIDLMPTDLVIPMSAHARTSMDSTWATHRNTSWITTVGRLRHDSDVEVAIAQATASRKFDDPDYGAVEGETAILMPVKPGLRTDVGAFDDGNSMRRLSVLLLGISLVVLLIACANLANLLIARTIRRSRELAVRIALGISTTRLIRMLAAEAVLVVAAGGLLGVILSRWLGSAVRALLIEDVDWVSSALDLRLALYVGVLLLLCAIVLTVAPALQLRRTDVQTALKTGIRDGGGRRSGVRRALVTAQAALCVILLVGAGLCVRSLRNVQSIDLGFEPDRVLAMRWDQRGSGRTEAEWTSLYNTAAERLKTMPQVERVALTTSVPFVTSTSVKVTVPGRDSLPPMPHGGPYYTAADDAYFATMGTAIRRGRAFTAADVAGAPPVAIVDEAFADLVWPGESPLGRTVCPADVCRAVIGVAQNSLQLALLAGPIPQIFVPLAQESQEGRALLIRPRQDDPETRASIHSAVQNVTADLPYASLRSFTDIVEPVVGPGRTNAALFTAFGLLALTVAITGLYSVMSYAVTARRHEMAVRLAFGADHAGNVRLVVREAAEMLALGVVLGGAAALYCSRWLTDLLFDVSPRDPAVYVSVALIVLATGALAAFIPARRTRNMSSADALRDA